MNVILLLTNHVTSLFSSYLTGIIVAAFILGYLIYSLVKPEKF